MSGRRNFEEWIRQLTEDVIEGEFGYEPGEFSVFPEHWRPLFRKGLTPRQAWQRALDAGERARKEKDRLKAENWARIQAADAALSEPRP